VKNLSGKVALVTGASRGIGRAVARVLAEAGCDVVVSYRTSQAQADEVVKLVEATGRRAVAIQGDVSKAEDDRRLVMRAEAEVGPVDILVNNAGINPRFPLDAITEDDWHRVLAVNLTSAFLLSQIVLPGMRKRQWGRLIMVSSIAAQTGGVIGPHYAASKAGLHGLVHSYATLLATEGITANIVAPALIDTEMIRNNPAVTPGLLPVGRFGTPDEVARVVLMLAENGYVTGQTVNVNGGWYMS
jgi:3-oxoacyl-[acyl-carrier protein] reductase